MSLARAHISVPRLLCVVSNNSEEKELQGTGRHLVMDFHGSGNLKSREVLKRVHQSVLFLIRSNGSCLTPNPEAGKREH